MRKLRQFTPDEDSPLLLSWHRGDVSAFETLTWKYLKRIYNLAILLSGDHETAAIATENSFLTAYHEIRSLTSKARFSTWLVAITMNECRNLNYFSSAGASPAESPPQARSHDITYPFDPEMKKKLGLCIKNLPVELAEVILLRYVRGYSLEQMEEIFQIRADSLLARLFEAEESLTACLKSGITTVERISDHKGEESSAPHPEIRRNFSAYLDSSTDDEEKIITKEHLKSCGSCREALADLEWMIEHLKSLPDEEPPLWLTSSIMQKAQSAPKNPAEVNKPSHLAIQVTAGLLILAGIGFATYFLRNNDEISTTHRGAESASSPAGVVKPDKERNSSPAEQPIILKGAFRGAGLLEDKMPKAAPPQPATRLYPQEIAPSRAPSAPSPSLKPELPSAAVKAEQFQQREKAESSPQLPSEWGNSSLPNRTPQKTAAPRYNSGELAVVLSTADPVAAIQEIETAVTSLGGRITGRAYSSGNDILYTRIELDKLFDLMSRLGRVGKIQELPNPPDDAEGMIDLVIRW